MGRVGAMVAFCGERLFLDEGDSIRKLRVLCANARGFPNVDLPG